ncbi:unnamed protein product [Prunus armeniaca]
MSSMHRKYSWLKRAAYSRRGSSSPYRSIYKSSAEYKLSVWIMKWSSKSSTTEGRREKETHTFVIEVLASEGGLKRVDMGEGILLARVEGNVEAWLRPEGLMAVALLTLKMPDLFKEESHSRVGMRENTEC